MVNRQRDRSSRCSSVALLAPAPSVQSAVRRPSRDREPPGVPCSGEEERPRGAGWLPPATP